MMHHPIVVLGSTATGKSALGIKLAKHFDGEIVSLDAYQIYRGLDIATAKVSNFNEIQHHLIDVVDVSYPMSVKEFQARARNAISEIQARSRVPILVGGSALYIQAVLYDFEFQPTNPEVRVRLQRLADEIGSEALHQRLAEVDPNAAASIARADTRRIVRALEVNEVSGQHYVADLSQIQPWIDHTKIGLRIDQELLRTRVTTRVKDMFTQGLVNEVRALEASGLFESSTARKAIGYEEAWLVASGEVLEDEAVLEIVRKTMQFAKRQMKWFKRDSTIAWFDADSQALFQNVRDFLEEQNLTKKV